MKKIVLLLGLIVLSLVGCGSESEGVKGYKSEEVSRAVTKEREIEIDWSKLTGNVYYAKSEGDKLDDFGEYEDLYLILNIPKDMEQLYYSNDEKYAGHKNIRLLLNGELIDEYTVRTSNRIVFRAKYKLDGTLSDENYDIEDPDGNIQHIAYEFIEDEKFMEKELDIYKTSEGFYWFPSKDITIQRGNKLEWDMNGMKMNLSSKEVKVELRTRDTKLNINNTYKTNPEIHINLSYEEPWSITVSLNDGVTKKEFMDELKEHGLYLKIKNDKGETKMIKLIDDRDTSKGYE